MTGRPSNRDSFARPRGWLGTWVHKGSSGPGLAKELQLLFFFSRIAVVIYGGPPVRLSVSWQAGPSSPPTPLPPSLSWFLYRLLGCFRIRTGHFSVIKGMNMMQKLCFSVLELDLTTNLQDIDIIIRQVSPGDEAVRRCDGVPVGCQGRLGTGGMLRRSLIVTIVT